MVAGKALTAVQTGESIQAGITDINRHKSDITIANAAKAGAEYYADKGSDLVPVSSALKVGGSYSTYFLYAFFTNAGR